MDVAQNLGIEWGGKLQPHVHESIWKAWYSSSQITSVAYRYTTDQLCLVIIGFPDQNKSVVFEIILKTQTDETLQRKWRLILWQFRQYKSRYSSWIYWCLIKAVRCHFCLPEVFWDSQFSATPEQQSASMTRGYQVHSQLYYVKYHMPGEGSIARGSRRLPESPSSLQIQQKCVKTWSIKSNIS